MPYRRVRLFTNKDGEIALLKHGVRGPVCLCDSCHIDVMMLPRKPGIANWASALVIQTMWHWD